MAEETVQPSKCMAKILIIEDDQDFAAGVSKMLSSELHTVETSLTGRDGMDRCLEGHYDLIILDLGLPDIDGLSICKAYRDNGGTCPVLILTGRNQLVDKVDGLDLGADDYLTKPFHMKELSARIRALLRRPATVKHNELSVGNVVINTVNHTVYKDGQKVTLYPVDYALLEFLFRHANETFNADSLLSKVWSTDKSLTENAVRTSIRRLRRALDGTDGTVEKDSIIETVTRVGYRVNKI